MGGSSPALSTSRAPRLFLSYNTQDRAVVEQVRQALVARGISVFIDTDLPPGAPWFDHLDRELSTAAGVAVFVGPHGFGQIQKREMWFALDRQAKEEKAGRNFPVIPVLIGGASLEDGSGFLVLNTWIDLRGRADDPAALDRIVGALGSAEQVAEPNISGCPYRDLRVFREEDHPVYFGREAYTTELLAKVLQQSFVAVVGASGSGKSSLVRAGLIPALRLQRPPAHTWDAIVCTPGSQPYRSLALELVRLWSAPDRTRTEIIGESEDLGKRLEQGLSLRTAVDEVVKSLKHSTRLLIVVDQFEELFTRSPIPRPDALRDDQHGTAHEGRSDSRTQFIDDLLQVANTAAAGVVITLRGDFYGTATAVSRDLSDQIARSIVNVGPMKSRELRSAIEQPAVRSGLRFQDGLVDRILNDVAEQPGYLPLLEFALTELWNNRQGNQLTHSGYDASGGVQGAVTRRGDAVYDQLNARYPHRILPVLSRLVQVTSASEEGGDTRQVLPLSELTEEEVTIVREFANARLLVISGTPETGGVKVEVAHEALIREWAKLGEYIDHEREFLIWRQRLIFLLREWTLANKSPDAMLRGSFLREATRWRTQGKLNAGEATFVEASERADAARVAELRRPRRWKMVAATTTAALMLSFAGWEAWTRTDQYQVRRVIDDTPEFLASAERQTVADAVRTLAVSLSPLAARDAANELDEPVERARALVASAILLVRLGRNTDGLEMAKSAVDVLAKTEGDDLDAARVLGDACSVLVEMGNPLHSVAGRIINPFNRAIALASLAQQLKATKNGDAARTAAKEAAIAASEIAGYGRLPGLLAASNALRETGDLSAAVDAVLAAKAAAFEFGSLRQVATLQATKLFVALVRTAGINESKDLLEPVIDKVINDDSGGAAQQVLRSLVETGQFQIAQHAVSRMTGSPRLEEIRPKAVDGWLDGLATLAKSGRAEVARNGATYLSSEVDRSRALAAIAVGLIEAGKLHDAESLIKTIDTSAWKVQTSVLLAQALVKAQRSDRAGKVAAATLQMASGIAKESRDQFIFAIDAIVTAPAVADTVAALVAARAATANLPPFYRTRALVSLGRALRHAGLVEEAVAVAREGLGLTREGYLLMAGDKGVLRTASARLLETLGPLEVGQLARIVPSDPWSDVAVVQTMAEIAAVLATAGHHDEAVSLTEQAFSAASKVADDDDRSEVYRTVAVNRARLHQYREARDAALLCTSSDDRLQAYVAILQQHAIERNASLAKTFEELPIRPVQEDDLFNP